MKTVTKIVILISLSVLVLVAVANWISLRQTKETLNERTQQLLGAVLDFSATQVRDNAATIKRFTEVVSHDPAISRALYLDASIGVNQVLNQFVHVFPFCAYIAIVTLDGEIFAVNTQDAKGEKIPGEELLGRSVAKNPVFMRPPSSSEVTMGDPDPDPYFALLDNATGMSQWFVSPVFKESQQIGWVVLSYNWQEELSALLQKVRGKLTLLGRPVTQMHIVDEKGHVIVRSEPARDESSAVQNQVRRERELLVGNTPMKLVIAVDSSWINEPIAAMKTYFLGSTAVLTLIMVAILYFILDKTFLQKVKMLETAAKQFSYGNLAYRLPSLGSDEMGLFAATFNAMGESIQEASLNLEKKVEERTVQLHQSELKFRTVADFTYNWETWVGPDGSLLYVSPSCERITGYSPEEFINDRKLIARIVHPADKPIVGDHFDKLSSSGPCSMEFRIVTRSGEERWVAHACQPIFDGAGQWLGRRGSNRDITDRKSAEIAVQESREQLSLAIEGSGVGTWDWNVQTGETVFNERWAQIIGYTLNDLEPVNIETWIKHCHPDDLQRSDELLTRHFAGETLAYECEARMRHKDGNWVWVLDRGKVTQWDADGKPLRVSGTHLDITHRKQMEEALLVSEQRYRVLFEHATDAILIIALEGDDKGRIVDCNQVAAVMNGYTIEELLNLKLETLDSAESAEGIPARMERLLKGEWIRAETTHRRKDGSEFPVEISVGIIEFENTRYALSVERDISQRKQEEESLRQSEQRFRTLFQDHSAVMLLIDPDSGAIVDANLSAADYYGYSRDELLLMSIDQINCLQPDHTYDYRQRATEQKENYFVFPHRLADGDVRTVEVYSSPIEIEGRRLLFSIVHDITERKSQEEELQKYREHLEDLVNRRTEELQKSELHFRNLVEYAGDPILVFDVELDRIVDCNQQACIAHGYTRDELLRLTMSQIELNFNKEQIEKICRSLKPGQAVTVEGENTRKDGSTFPTETRVGLISSTDTHLTIGIIRDITDRMQAMQEKESLQKQLFQSQKMEAIGTLAAGIAHDFNNILFAITGYGEIALDDVPKDSFAYRNMRLSLNAADRAADLVRHILTFSREADQQKGTILLGPIVKESLKFLKSSLPASIEVRSLIKAGLHPVHADPTQMHQVFMNLMTNAFHATKDAGGSLTVNLDEVEVTEEMAATIPGLVVGTYNRLRVSDTGYGMSPEVLERIFDPFFTTKEKGEGTGLGLSVVDGIVKTHGGVIKVESSQGVGTTFEVYLPIEETDTQICHAETVLPVSPVSLKRILFVDDDRMVTGAAQGNLEQLGFDVITENDPVRALALFEESPHSFDLIMTDIGMPKMTGLQLAERIREIRRDIPVIAITGYADLMNKDEAVNSGIVDVIYKPIRRITLAQTIAKVLSKEAC